MFKAYKLNESGRSMVEMLGVLAIIGVLSVAGVIGYTQAMRSHKANEIANAVSILYMKGTSHKNGKGDEDIDYTTAFGDLPADVSVLRYNRSGTISITITDELLCAAFKNKLGPDRITGDCYSATSILTVKMKPDATTE